MLWKCAPRPRPVRDRFRRYRNRARRWRYPHHARVQQQRDRLDHSDGGSGAGLSILSGLDLQLLRHFHYPERRGQYIAAATFMGGTQPALCEFRGDSHQAGLVHAFQFRRSFHDQRSPTRQRARCCRLTLIPEMGGRPLAQLPLHLIGHSRGGSVVTEMARLLGAQGVWVDQVTTLDPRPVPHASATRA